MKFRYIEGDGKKQTNKNWIWGQPRFFVLGDIFFFDNFSQNLIKSAIIDQNLINLAENFVYLGSLWSNKVLLDIIATMRNKITPPPKKKSPPFDKLHATGHYTDIVVLSRPVLTGLVLQADRNTTVSLLFYVLRMHSPWGVWILISLETNVLKYIVLVYPTKFCNET